MQFNFQEIIDGLNDNLPFGDNFAYQIARTKLMPGDYLFNTLLPNETKPTYHVSGGSLRIFPTMLGQVPMDTPLPPIGAMTSTQFFENTTKLGGQMHFPEATLRELQEFATYLRSQGIGDGLERSQILLQEKERLVDSVIGFADLLLKAQWDTYEWLKGLALTDGRIDWKYGKLDLTVDYDIPAANKKNRTGVDAYYNTSSKFWADIRYAFTILNNFQIIMNSKTYYSIIDNPVNHIVVTSDSPMVKEIIYFNRDQTVPGQTDKRERARIVIYDKSGTKINAKTGELIPTPFLRDGYIIIVGEMKPEGFELLQGSTEDPENMLRLGYTHLAPTVEGGRMGIWQRVYTPEQKPYQLHGETASNGLPVIMNPKKLVILKTAMPA